MKSFIRTYTELIPLLIAFLFAYTAVSKVYDWQGTEIALRNQVFPLWMVEGLLWGLPAMELTVAIMVLTQKWRRRGMWASFGLMVTFTGYLGLVILNVFDRVPCSCGGILSGLGWEEHLVFNLTVLVLMVVWVMMYEAGRLNRRT
ncbi:MauE/DoxX family redox-associated membrane protein [Echinicola sp. 20G]|uniref:MauE/DoxX family redox-associated membrane protein n=1 Tax=Echinicola sp. 20G TaxID=2781961 RepID=UPI0019105EFB|nr:MauE/DoxX family redox-associated membrane protein [Echinicola sp. 20G]